jgi:4-amino-4-deoxy-L-arabinose transferase-like glycosyltransferase
MNFDSLKKILFRPSWVIFPVLLFILLRFPALFWDWWYGDENIYLALASDINHGEWLYSETWDNKPPMLYLLYALIFGMFGPEAFVYRSVSLILGVVTVCLFYLLFEEIFPKQRSAKRITTIAFAISWGLMFEAPLLNAENLFVPFTMAGFLLVLKYRVYPNIWLLFLTGVFWAVASLTKVHTFAEILILAWISSFLKYSKSSSDSILFQIKNSILHFILLLFPTLLAVLMMIGFFWNAGFLYELYMGTIGFSSSYVSDKSGIIFGIDLVFVSGLQLRLFVTTLVIAVTAGLFLYKHISEKTFILLTWLSIAIFGALISDRPYPHYVLQVLPVGFLILTLVFLEFRKMQSVTERLKIILISALLIQFFLGNFVSPAGRFWNYYGIDKYFAILTVPWSNSLENWQTSFDKNLINTHKNNVDKIKFNTNPDDSIYIYGDFSALYGLSRRRSAANHITLFNISNWDEIFFQLQKDKPKLILVDYSKFKYLPDNLSELLQDKYKEIDKTDEFVYFIIKSY